MPASVTPSRTPCIANKSEGRGFGRFTAIYKSRGEVHYVNHRCLTQYQPSFPWHCLYFFPEPQGHGSFRPTFWPRTKGCTLISVFACSSASSWSTLWWYCTFFISDCSCWSTTTSTSCEV